MSDNKRIWDMVNKPPKTALKTIKGGRLNGKSDINPQWRLQAMTEMFGPCGVGWGYSIDKLWSEDGSHDQKMCFAMISLWYVEGGKKSDPIPGIGGSMLVDKESSGLHTSDEGYKMALTDALSVAMKTIGVAAEIYLGNFDGTKYKDHAEPALSATKASAADPLAEDKEKAKATLVKLGSNLTVSQQESANKKYKSAKNSKDLADLITWAQEMAELNAAPKMPDSVERASKVFDGEVVDVPEDIH